MAASAKPRRTAASVANAWATVLAGSHAELGVPTGAIAGATETVIVENWVRELIELTCPWSCSIWVRTLDSAASTFRISSTVLARVRSAL